MAEPLVQERDEARPQRRDRAGAADDEVLTVNPNLVATGRVGVSRNVGHATADATSRVGRARYVSVALPARQIEDVADTAAGGAIGPLVPHDLAADAVAR